MSELSSKEQLADELENADVETILETDLLDRVAAALRATTEPCADDRTAFERWCKDSGEFTDWTKFGDRPDEYQKPRVQLAWKAWQAARAAQPPSDALVGTSEPACGGAAVNIVRGVQGVWQPIETAPDDECVFVAHIDGQRLCWAQAAKRGAGVTRLCWFNPNGKSTPDPTHWMPLPSTPTKGEDQ